MKSLDITSKMKILGVILIVFGVIELIPSLLGISKAGLLLLTPVPLAYLYIFCGLIEILIAINEKR